MLTILKYAFAAIGLWEGFLYISEKYSPQIMVTPTIDIETVRLGISISSLLCASFILLFEGLIDES